MGCEDCNAIRRTGDISKWRVVQKLEKQVTEIMNNCSEIKSNPVYKGDGTANDPHRVQCPNYKGKI